MALHVAFPASVNANWPLAAIYSDTISLWHKDQAGGFMITPPVALTYAHKVLFPDPGIFVIYEKA